MKHEARVRWKLRGDMASGRYSRAHELLFDGGAVVTGSPSPGIVPAPWSNPAAVDPEEAFVAALAACHMLWFLDLARREGFTAESYDDRAFGVMTKNDAGALWISHVTLRPKVRWTHGPDAEAEAALHEAAHHACFIANSVKSEITIETPRGDRHDRRPH
ncbi:OsmC family protein [Pikeienuella sp. HZG-20]|uniref:OsmC family protein n=1 Tax=Paludibacillus litoralis TaxID=3133267 RepID=UPI0030EED662